MVRQFAPVCRRVGSYSLAAERGRNVVHLPAQIGRRRLGVGTYTLVGRTRAGRLVFQAKAQIVRRRLKGATRRTLIVRRGAVVPRCAPPAQADASFAGTTPAGAVTSAAPHAARGAFVPPAQGSDSPGSRIIRGIVLSRTATPYRSLLLVLLAISLGLLSASAVPDRALPAGPVAAVIARRRTQLALAGIYLLAVVVAVAVLT